MANFDILRERFDVIKAEVFSLLALVSLLSGNPKVRQLVEGLPLQAHHDGNTRCARCEECCSGFLFSLVETHRYLPTDMLACLPGITFEQLKEFASVIFEVRRGLL